MEVIGIAANIAGLVALADLVFRYSARYAKGCKGAQNEVREISREIKNLSLVLHNLSLVASELEETQSTDTTQPSLLNLKLIHLHDCQQLLRRLEKGLVNAQSNLDSTSRVKRLQGRLTWPFSSADTKALLEDVGRHKQTIELAVTADSLSKLRLLLSQQSATNSGIDMVKGMTEKILDIETKVVLDKKKKEVLQFFTYANPHSEFDTNRKLRHDLTGLWLTEGSEFEEWYAMPGSKIWCSGIPGAGKSVLAAAIIDECLQRNAVDPSAALAYFFCTYKDPQTQQPISILSSICSQLARQDENAFQILEAYHDKLTVEHQLQAGASEKELIKILREMCSFFGRVYVIVDGLDECGKQAEESVKCLAGLLPTPDDETLNLALLSRDEVAIREIVGYQFQNIEIEAHTEDIQLYVASELEQRIGSRKLRLRDLSLKDMIMTRLIDGAKGMFRWVACQLDHLCELPSDGARRKALDKLPPTLFDTYERILIRINDSLEQNKQLVQKTLLLISSPYHAHLSLRQICEAISLQEGELELLEEDIVDGEEVLRWCGSLVRMRRVSSWNDEVGIEFSHFSVQEYLQSDHLEHSKLSAFSISRQKACRLLASVCLDYLTLENHNSLPEEEHNTMRKATDKRDMQRPFYRHAAKCWPFYVREAGQNCCLEAMHDLFHLSETPSFCSWVAELAAHVLSIVCQGRQSVNDWVEEYEYRFTLPFSIFRQDFTPLHMAAALGMPDLCDYLLRQGADVNSNGKFGTPLHCAIAGLGAFTFNRPSNLHMSVDIFSSVDMFDMIDQNLGRRQSILTAQVLLYSGANPHLAFTDDKKGGYSSLSLVAIWSHVESNLGIAAKLIQAGMTIGEEDLVHFQRRYRLFRNRVNSSGEYSGRNAIVSLLGVLSPPNTETKGTPSTRLYIETYDCAARLGMLGSNQLAVMQSTPSFIHDDVTIRRIIRCVKYNDDLQLSRLLENSRSEAVRSARFGDDRNKPGWTALHLAVHYRSLDVLNVLLDHGLDADAFDHDGLTPVHLCDNNDMLRALLQHGASTLLPDKTQETVWHYFAKKGNGGVKMLDLLVAPDVRQEALQMVSSSNETPICTALNHGNVEEVLFLLQYCDSRDYWKSGKSIFRKATELMSTEVLQRLHDLGIEPDGMDDVTGSPLHHVPITSTVECIQLLTDLFPLDQRRKEDLRTPLESLLLRAVGNSSGLDYKVLRAMIPGNAVSCPNEASSLWSFVSVEVLRKAMYTEAVSVINSPAWAWLLKFVFALIELGIMGKYEERNGFALLPFVSGLVETVVKAHQAVQHGLILPKKFNSWAHISATIARIVARTNHWGNAVDHPDITQFLSFLILHDDHEMISLLLQRGVSVHARVKGLSPFEFACFPKVPIKQKSFALLLKHATPQKMSEGNDSFDGCGPLHFVAGWHGKKESCTWRLRELLQAGVDPNLPLSRRGSPLTFHISEGAIETAEMLLESGANPWTRGSYPFDAPLAAVRYDHHEILTKIAAIHPKSPCWGQTWAETLGEDENKNGFAGGNALHLATFHENAKCLEFYLDQGLLSDLECHDARLETPMHYASRFSHPSVIKVLEARGGNIDARNFKGWTPLHFAANKGCLITAKTLISLGAKQQACNDGCIPLALAYARGDALMMQCLQWSSEETRGSNPPITSPAILRTVADAMHNAILQGASMACKRIHDLGCPIDVEIQDGERVTPLAVAACQQEGMSVVRWLVKSGAAVSVAFPQPYQGQYSSPLEAAVANPSMNRVLPELLNKYLDEGASFLDMDQSPLHVAVEHHNLEGLKTVLGWLRDTYGNPGAKASQSSCLARDSMSERETFSTFVNQHHAKGPGGTALHLAAEQNETNACAALISNRANIEEPNRQKETPLHVAARCGSLQVAECLLQHGARPNPLDLWAETPLMSAYRESQWELVDLLTPYCKDMMRTNHVGENGLHFMTMNGLGPARKGVLLGTLSRYLEQGVSLYLRDNDGVTPMHWILASQSACQLRFLLNKGDPFLRPREIAQWPRDWFFVAIHKLAAISKNLRLIRPFLSKHELCQISGVAERGSHSLLCRAACWGSVEVIESLLELGLDMVEHQCKDHGTPLTAAISRGHIEAAKCLVRNGATVPYCLCQPSDFEVSVGNPDFAIREWLFVGRHLERRRILNITAEASGKIESWAGVRTARVALKWEWKRRREESIWEYACRRQGILKELRGKVVRCHGEGDSGVDASGDASDNVRDEEFSSRYYCLGQERIRGARLVY